MVARGVMGVSGSEAAEDRERRERSPWVMLGLATVGFAVNFWAWALDQSARADVP